jgi:hypothetical protein
VQSFQTGEAVHRGGLSGGGNPSLDRLCWLAIDSFISKPLTRECPGRPLGADKGKDLDKIFGLYPGSGANEDARTLRHGQTREPAHLNVSIEDLSAKPRRRTREHARHLPQEMSTPWVD